MWASSSPDKVAVEGQSLAQLSPAWHVRLSPQLPSPKKIPKFMRSASAFKQLRAEKKYGIAKSVCLPKVECACLPPMRPISDPAQEACPTCSIISTVAPSIGYITAPKMPSVPHGTPSKQNHCASNLHGEVHCTDSLSTSLLGSLPHNTSSVVCREGCLRPASCTLLAGSSLVSF